MKFRFTDDALTKLKTRKPNEVHSDIGDVKGFAVRVTASGNKTFLLNYRSPLTDELRRLVLGSFGRAPALSVSAAREVAKEKRALVDAGRDPWQEGRQRKADSVAARARSDATLSALMDAYVEHLKLAGKPSAAEVASTVARNVMKAHPKIAALPVHDITVDSVMPVFRTLTRAGKFRAAEKLAAHMRAAFNKAKAAGKDAGIVSFAAFDISTNPLLELTVSRPDESAITVVESGGNDSGALSVGELRNYWKAITKLDTPHGALMRFHLLTGGQRMEQLSRLTLRDWDHDANTVTLMDTKGRRRKARAHVVPLLPDAIAALEDMRTDEPAGPHLFTVSAGARAAVPHTLAAAMREVSALLLDKEQVSMSITPGTIRRTVETRLAASRVSKDARAHLQSHGLGGVQDRHYDRHDYIDQKREALQVLRDMLDKPPTPGNVVPLRKRR